MMTTTSWDRLFNGSDESRRADAQGDFKVIATTTVRYSCGTTSELVLIRERGSWYVKHPDYSERFTSKKRALAAYPAFAA